jgi:hypothetical protein
VATAICICVGPVAAAEAQKASGKPGIRFTMEPYDYENCFTSDLGTGACGAAGMADAAGNGDAEAHIISDLAGRLPSSGNAMALAEFDIKFTLVNPVPALAVTATFHVNEATTSWHIEPQFSPAGEGTEAKVLTHAFLYDFPIGCDCLAGTPDVVVSSTSTPGNGPTVSDRDVVHTLEIRRDDGASLPTGAYEVRVRNYAMATLGQTADERGQVDAKLDGRLGAVRIVPVT